MIDIRGRGKRRAVVLTIAVLSVSALTGIDLSGTAVADPLSQSSAEPAAVAAVHAMPLVAGTPCTSDARACVDLETQRAWLLDGGRVVRGPVKIGLGGPGKETPVGHSLRVYLKDKDHVSSESFLPNGQPSPMPWSVFFNDGGIAFHGGDPYRQSAGCVRLPLDAAMAWFDFLQVGDRVQVVRGDQERAERADLAG